MIPRASLTRTATLFLITFGVAILYPYQFGWPEDGIVASVKLLPQVDPAALIKTVAHIILFLPVGLMLGWTTTEDNPRAARTAMYVVALLALGSELAHLFVVNRSASVQDATADFVGAFLGYRLGKVGRDCVLDPEQTKRINRWRAAVAALPALFVVVALIALKNMDFFGWDPTYRLLLGNEDTLDRPWSGEIYEVALFDRALSPEEADALSIVGDEVSETSTPGPLASYAFNAKDLEFNDLGLRKVRETSSHMPDMSLNVIYPELVEAAPDGGIVISRGGALRSEVAPKMTYDAIRRAQALTVMIEFTAPDPNAVGPARIFSASLDPNFRNLTIGQKHDHLVYRIRNRVSGPNGTDLQIESDECLRLGERQRVVAVTNANTTRLYTDGQQCAEVVYSWSTYALKAWGSRDLTSWQDLAMLMVLCTSLLYFMLLFTLQWQRPWRVRRELAALVISGTALGAVLSVDWILS